jgi:hypothetical protein
VFFWLAGVGGDGRRRAVNDGGGDVQRTTPETSGSVGMDGGWRLSTGGSGDGGRGGGSIYFMVSGGSQDKNLIPTYLNSILV